MSRSNDDLTRPSDTSAAGGSNGPNLALIAFGIIAVLVIIFFLQNGEETSIDFWVFEATSTKRWTILMSILFGVVLDRLFGFWWRRRKRKKAAID